MNAGACKRLPAPLLRSEAMWHKVSSSAADQRRASSSRLSAFRKKCVSEMGEASWRGRRGRGTREGAITSWEMSAVVAKTRDSPDQRYHHQAEGRHFSLQSVEFLTSGSRGRPAQLLKKKRGAVPAVGSRKHLSRRDARRSREKRISNQMDCPLPNLSASEWEITRPAQTCQTVF